MTQEPFIYDTTGTLLTLLHWRQPHQALWVPLLDTALLPRLASGRKSETYWPVAVADSRFYCIILKGGDRHPYFPRPLLSDFDFRVPLTSPSSSSDQAKLQGQDGDGVDAAGAEGEIPRLEEALVRQSALHTLATDTAAATRSTAARRAALAAEALEIDKVLLQLLAAECVAGEERGMKCMELVGLMRDRSGRVLEAARKVAGRFERGVLGEKIVEVEERRLLGRDGEDRADGF